MDDDDLKPASNGLHDLLSGRRDTTRLDRNALGRPVETIGTPLLLI